MGLPSKRRTPRSKHERAAHFALSPRGMSRCTSCGAPTLPHTACPSCGMYRGKKAVPVAKRADRARRKAVKK